jgi:heme A synthase
MLVDIIVHMHYYNVALVLASGLITGVWGLILYFRKLPITEKELYRPWRISLIITAILGLLQGALGLTLVALGQKPGGGVGLYYLHYVYGAIVAFAIPVALTYTTSGKNPRRDMLIFSIAALILVAAGIRGWMTGPYPPIGG